VTRVRRLIGSVGWKSALGELLLIIVGILGALAVNAWWDGRKDASTEASYLQQLLADVDANERVIKEFMDYHAGGRDAATRLASHFDAPGPLPGCETLADLLTTSLQWASLELRTGTFSALLATGDIRLIRDDALRGEVIRYAGVVNSITMLLAQDEPQGWAASQVFRRRVTFFWKLFETPKPSDPPLWTGCNFEPFRRDPEVRAGLFTTQLLHNNRVKNMEQLAVANALLQSELRSDLGVTKAKDDTQRAPK
jgi:hypothetical protein